MDWLFWVVSGATLLAAVVLIGGLVWAFWPQKKMKDQNDILNKTLNDVPDANRFYPYH